MWDRSAANKETGLFTVTCIDWNGETFFKGEFSNTEDARLAGEDAERRMTMAMQLVTAEPIGCDMTDDELLAELVA